MTSSIFNGNFVVDGVVVGEEEVVGVDLVLENNNFFMDNQISMGGELVTDGKGKGIAIEMRGGGEVVWQRSSILLNAQQNGGTDHIGVDFNFAIETLKMIQTSILVEENGDVKEKDIKLRGRVERVEWVGTSINSETLEGPLSFDGLEFENVTMVESVFSAKSDRGIDSMDSFMMGLFFYFLILLFDFFFRININ